MHKKILISGAVFCFLAVAIGAFGAHALQPILTEYGRTDTFETGVKYQIFHGLALLIVGLISTKKPNKLFTYSASLFGIGILIFSGSLYLLSTLNIPVLGAITPIGGVCFLTGWILFIVAVAKTEF